jgi:SAM-dependent methyltransferase
VPAIYERWWRPAWGRVLKGAFGGGMRDEHRIARLLLGLTPGDGVLDVACGPGNFTREFAQIVGEPGLAVGIDASPTMLARAVADTPDGSIAYVRGDAVDLPFRDASFDAVCCFGALHLFADPDSALDHMTRVLTPGGRIAILTSCRLRSAPGRAANELAGTRSGIRMFGADEIVDRLNGRGYAEVRQRIAGLTQFVGGRLTA